MVIDLKYDSPCVYEYFSKELNDNLTIKELKELIEKEYYNWFVEYVKGFSDYTEEEKQELLDTFLNEKGKCHWSIGEVVYID